MAEIFLCSNPNYVGVLLSCLDFNLTEIKPFSLMPGQILFHTILNNSRKIDTFERRVALVKRVQIAVNHKKAKELSKLYSLA
jgi:hypothetical protein